MKKKIRFIIPSIITLLILLLLFYIQGLYPFRDNSIVQVDADYQFIPVLYRIYDFLHGNGSIIYDDIGLGNNIYISMIIQGSIFSPVSLLLYFTSRDNIVNYFNIIVIVKMCLLSLTTYIYINKKFKINEYYKIVFSVLYSFCGWILLNYFNIMWLDSVILFPLIVMYLDDLIDNDKYMGYIITLGLSLIISYYISYFILLFILFYSFMRIFLYVDKSKLKEVIFRLGISTLVAILLASFSLLPALYQTFISSRLDGTSYKSLIFSNMMNKSLYLMLSTIFIVLFINLMFKYKKDNKKIYFYIVLFMLFGIGLLIEPINLGIHLGSYWSFPYRYSFITLFILMDGSLYYINKFGIKGYSDYQRGRLVLFIIFGLILLYGYNICISKIVNSQIVLDFKDIDVYINIVIIFLIMVVMIMLSLSFSDKKIRYGTFSICCILQIFIYSSFTMYYSNGYYLSKNANLIDSNMDIVMNDLGRYKMGYRGYTPDYGFIYQVNTLDNWLHILPKNEIDVYKRLGYQNSDTCIRSYGGTIFSDWLFNVKYFIDNKEDNEKLYKLLDSYNGYYLYEYRYNSGFGLVYDKKIDSNNYKDLWGFDLDNQIYRDLFNMDSDIVKIDRYSYVDNDKIVIDYEIENEGNLYIDIDSSSNSVSYIKINDRYIDYSKDEDYIIDLGMYSDDVRIEIGKNEDYSSVSFRLGFIKYEDIVNLSSNVDNVKKISNGYEIEVNNEMDNGYLFIPINKIDGLVGYVNDRKVEIDSYMDNFVSIKLDKGNNKIRIKYEMPLFKIGIILSIVGLISLLFIGIIPKKKIMLNITYYVYIVIVLLVYIYMYGYSLFKYYG